MKVKRRVYEENGCWYLERTDTRGRITAVQCQNEEAAKRLLEIANTYSNKRVLLPDDFGEVPCEGKVTNVALLYENGVDKPPIEVLHVRFAGATYEVLLAECTLI